MVVIISTDFQPPQSNMDTTPDFLSEQPHSDVIWSELLPDFFPSPSEVNHDDQVMSTDQSSSITSFLQPDAVLNTIFHEAATASFDTKLGQALLHLKCRIEVLEKS
jgi:hypothetical protein